MKTRCPCCGAENSLDALIANEDARQAMWAVAQIQGDIGKLVMQYIALFRPSKTTLTFDRMAKLLNEILPDLQRGTITRERVDYPAPPEVWEHALREMLIKRNSGSLKLPLRSHGYLYEVISSWQGQGLQTLPIQDCRLPEKEVSKTLLGAAAINKYKVKP